MAEEAAIAISVQPASIQPFIQASIVGLLTLFSMTKIWNEVFWKKTPEETQIITESKSIKNRFSLFIPIIFLALITVVIGFNAEPFFDLAQRASDQLMNPQYYIDAVLKR